MKHPLSPEDEAYAAAYRPERWPRPGLAVDIAVFLRVDAELRVLLIRRGEPPYRGRLALPGGFVRIGETRDDPGEGLREAAERELEEETGIPRGSLALEQVGAFGDPHRDPRGRVVTVGWTAMATAEIADCVRAGDDAAEAAWHPVASLVAGDLAFDHDFILAAALRVISGG